MSARTRAQEASVLLASCGFDCPPDVGGVSVRAAPLWLRTVWRGPYAAITLPWGIYLRSSPVPSSSTAALILHELAHAEQWKRLGLFRFLWTYLSDYAQGRWQGLSHLESYRAISLEREARTRAASL